MLHMIKSNHIYITLTSFHTIHIPWNDNGDRSLNLGLGKKKEKKTISNIHTNTKIRNSYVRGEVIYRFLLGSVLFCGHRVIQEIIGAITAIF